MDGKVIGQQIKKARIDANLSQTQLGEKLGVTWEMISRYENGRSSPMKYLDKLASILSKSIPYFYGEEFEYNLDSAEKLVSVLKDSGFNYGTNYENKAPLLENSDLFNNSFDEISRLAKKGYKLPDWVSDKYSDVFVIRMKVLSDSRVDFDKNDVAIFTKSLDYLSDNAYVLIKTGIEEFSIMKYQKDRYNNEEIIGVLIYIERRYLL